MEDGLGAPGLRATLALDGLAPKLFPVPAVLLQDAQGAEGTESKSKKKKKKKKSKATAAGAPEDGASESAAPANGHDIDAESGAANKSDAAPTSSEAPDDEDDDGEGDKEGGDSAGERHVTP